MYLRPAFTETDLDRIQALIAANPFGMLVTHSARGLDASHLPFTVARDGDALVLEAHFAAANPQCAEIGGTALAIFAGPHAYISPGWYRTQPAVPTWDYAAAHVHGVLEPVTDRAPMTAMLRDLSRDDPNHFDMDTLPEKFRDAMMGGIRAFRLRSTRIEAQWKMSQNRSAADREGVIAALRQGGQDAVADLVAATLPPAP
jgi:transcriptional regulator